MKGLIKEILLAGVIFLQKLATAAADVLWLVLLAELIEDFAPQYVLGLIALSVWKRMGYSLGRIMTMRLQNMVELRLKGLIVEKTARIPYRLLEDYVFQELVNDLYEKINRGQEVLVWKIVQKLGNFILYCVKTLGLCVLLGWASPVLGLLFCVLEICFFGLKALEQEYADASAEKSRTERQYMEELALGHKSAGERSLFAYIDYVGKKCVSEAEAFRKECFIRALEQEKLKLANQVLMTIVFVLTESALTALMIDKRLSLGYFIVISIGTFHCLAQAEDVGEALHGMRESRAFFRQWNRFITLPETDNFAGKSGVLQDGFEKLEFKNVSFRYPRTGRYVLHDLNFVMTRGGYYAFVGDNGSGKTTIVKLLSGLYENYEGEIRINGIELREIPFEERRRIFSILFQDAARYEETIAKNIYPALLSEEKACSRNSRKMAEKLAEEWEAACGSSRFPQGADTFLGSMEDNGVMLSEGEWQRLLIARVFAQPALVRVLDEPMSSLDIFQQGGVYKQFTQGGGKYTTILFSHHMAAVRKARKIYVLRGGRVVEEGTHEQLMGEGGLYAKMYEAFDCYS